MNSASRLKKLARHLLATTCLTAGAVGVAQAGVVSEPPDFGNSFAGATPLPAGTDTVIGNVGFSTGADPDDFFEFSGLNPGSSFRFSITITDPFFFGSADVFNSSQVNLIPQMPYSNSPGTQSGQGIVPLDGNLIVQVHAVENGGGFTASLIESPEPSTLATAGLALAGALALRHKKKNS